MNLVYEWRDFTTVEDLKENGLYAGNGMYYAAGDFGAGILKRPATLYVRNGMCMYVYGGATHLSEKCKYLLDDGNFELVRSTNGKTLPGAVKYNDNYGIGRVNDTHSVLHVALIVFECTNGCIWWGNHAGDYSTASSTPHDVLIYKPLA